MQKADLKGLLTQIGFLFAWPLAIFAVHYRRR